MAANVNDLSKLLAAFPGQLEALENQVSTTKEEADRHEEQCKDVVSETKEDWSKLLASMKAFGADVAAQQQRVSNKTAESEKALERFQKTADDFRERLDKLGESVVTAAKATSVRLKADFAAADQRLEASKAAVEAHEQDIETAEKDVEKAAKEIPDQMKELFQAADAEESALFERVDEIADVLKHNDPSEGGTHDIFKHVEADVIESADGQSSHAALDLVVNELKAQGEPEILAESYAALIEHVEGLEDAIVSEIDAEFEQVQGDSEAVKFAREQVAPLVEMLPTSMTDLGGVANTFKTNAEEVQS